MPLELHEVDAERGFPALFRALIESYENPYQSILDVHFTPCGDDEASREARLKEAADRFANWHVNDPVSYWQKVVDTDTGEIVGGACWNIHQGDPFAQTPNFEITWQPNDGSREFVGEFLRQYSVPRALVGRKPQVYLFIIFTVPSYRCKGVAQKFMSWGMDKADELGVEMFLDAGKLGMPLYEANQFICLKENVIAPETDTPTEGWKGMQKKVSTVRLYLMWRPINGKYVEGEMKLPRKDA
ncbi:hypothetical protein F5Y08DRAFT_20028 [Xylaria arbuscula]|nr:hypothetical protein F5Y08DRAFT_20028 [Xylaria arbuscula]